MTRRTLPATWRAGAVFVAAVAAFAVLCATDDAEATTPSGVTAVWYAQGTDQWPADGQTLQAHTSTTALDLAFVQATADALGCGYTIQGDQYADDAITAALIAAGKLYAPGTAAESWPNGQYLPEYSTVFYTGDCVAEVEPIPTATPAPTASPEPTAPPEPVAETTTPDSPRADAAVEQVVAKTAPELAETGFDSPWLLAGGIALVIGGVLLMRAPFRAVQKKRTSK